MPLGRRVRMLGARVLASLFIAAECRAASVSWSGTDECTERCATVEEAERLLGRSLQEVDSVDFELDVSKASDGSWLLRLVTASRATQERRERLLSGASCDEVAAAAAVAMAMVVNSSEADASVATQREPARGEAVATAVPALEQNPPHRAAATTPRVPAAPAVATSLSAAVTSDVGSLPGFSWGVEGAASARTGVWQVTALGAQFAGARELGAGKGADFDLAFGGLLGCGRLGGGATHGLLCAGAEVGRMSGTGVGVRNPRSDSVFWWAPRVDAGVARQVGGRFAAFGRVGLASPQERRE